MMEYYEVIKLNDSFENFAVTWDMVMKKNDSNAYNTRLREDYHKFQTTLVNIVSANQIS